VLLITRLNTTAEKPGNRNLTGLLFSPEAQKLTNNYKKHENLSIFD